MKTLGCVMSTTKCDKILVRPQVITPLLTWNIYHINTHHFSVSQEPLTAFQLYDGRKWTKMLTKILSFLNSMDLTRLMFS